MTQLVPAPDLAYTPLDQLFAPLDVEQAHNEWQAHCGPAALAAILRLPVQHLRRCFPGHPQRPWVSPSDMTVALTNARVPFSRLGAQFPAYGLAHVQWHGPWLDQGVPQRVAYKYTHWIGCAQTPVSGRMVYDVNAYGAETAQGKVRGSWVLLSWWEREMVPLIVAEIPKATEGWHIRWSCQVET